MKACYTNATVMWSEQDIIKRENLVREIESIIKNTLISLNSAVNMFRCETPILTPALKLQEHISTGFELINAGERGYLRPETTAGTYEAFRLMFGDKPEAFKKNLPMCLWQVGLSFRDEKNAETMRASKLRLVQFYQLEFQLFCRHGTKAQYLTEALEALTKRFGGEIVIADELPHYSEYTLDWMIDGLEVAGCSVRKDWEHGIVFEIAIGLDRLVAIL